MKNNQKVSKKAEHDLKQILDIATFQSLLQRFKEQSAKQKLNTKYTTIEMKTPSTVDTTIRKRGSAINKSIRPQSRSRSKVKQTLINRTICNQITVTKAAQEYQQQNQSQLKNDSNFPTTTVTKKILTDRAIYFGNVQLPYLHSSDAISSLYQRSKINDNQNPQPLINPSPNISPHLLTNIKNLYLYYTGIDSLRQLGTGWSNLKSLTIMCSHLLCDLSGLSIFPSLQYLFVPHNNIIEISDLVYHTSLRCIDLQDNRIDLIDQIQYIYTVVNLQWADISQNPITMIKQKYRIISQNLGNKIQAQDYNKLFQYQMSFCQLQAEIFSYANMQICCNLIKQINQQICKQQIKIGEFWRTARSKAEILQDIDKNIPDVEIVDNFCQNQLEDEYQDEYQDDEGQRRFIQLRVTPLTQYIGKIVSIDPLKKYFNNKAYIQIKSENPIGQVVNTKPVQQKTEKQMINLTRIQRFAATQKLTSNCAASEQKTRLNSLSMKKRLTRVSLQKNINFPSAAASTILSNLKNKQQGLDSNCISSPSGLKFLSKRKLVNKQLQQLSKA